MNVIFSRNYGVALSLPRILSKRFVATSAKEESKTEDLDLKTLEEQPVFQDKEVGLSEEEIQRMRNKSRLNTGDRNVLNGIVPKNEVIHRFQETVRYKRRMFGRYGIQASDAPIGIAWPTEKEVEDIKEYESVLYPETLHQAWEKIAAKKIADAESIRERDETIVKNLSKLEKWTADLNARIAKKEAEALAARQRKDRLIEEVRRHFGYNISPKDERFKALLEQKDKADRKMKKAARKEAKQQKMMNLLAQKVAEISSKSKEKTESDDSKIGDNSS